ncbi:MAG: hypothetical protein JO356_18330 [Acidobacteria bacterium]|nr:hypothetical protein [Acidobacteriota bacterium]
MFCRSPGSKVFIAFAVFGLALSLTFCGSSSRKTQAASGLPFRAFISNPIFPNAAGGASPTVEIMDAQKDLLSPSIVPMSNTSSSVGDAGIMAVTPKRTGTLLFSPSDSKLAIINNTQESLSSAITLPGSTESILAWNDNVTAFVAIPSASVLGQPAGAVERIDLSAGTISATIPIPGAHYLVSAGSGNQILVFSDNSNIVTLLTPSLIGTGPQTQSQQSCSSIQTAVCSISSPGLDRPVSAAVTSNGSTAYIMNCGPECGGISSGVSVLDLTPIAVGQVPVVTLTIPVFAATTGLLQGSVLYVAGSLPPQVCNANAGLCGQLSVLDLSAGAPNVTCVPQPGNPIRACTVFGINDGYHNRTMMGARGQLFLGARNCTNLNTSSGMRGCLAIFDSMKRSVVLPPDNGDVTGIEAIPNRNVVYLCEGGKLRIYDTTTDQLQTNPAQPNIIGQAIDVKVVDF